MKKKERLEAKKEIESLFAEFKEKFPGSDLDILEERDRIYFRFEDLNGAGIGFDISNKKPERDYVLLSFFSSKKDFKGFSTAYFGKDSVNSYHFLKATKFSYPEQLVDDLRDYFEAIYDGRAIKE